ncbi:MAG TPA: N-glycosylase/DNA lyase [Candidatus Dormibacteraeota bacterium]|nr:N-glycosylase/DNA lyase [Candidatus Dormibacteraeota bacterium]
MSSNSSSTQLTMDEPDERVRTLQALYRERKDAIQKRLSEFRQVMSWTDEEVFGELAFCLLTPQSSAKICWDAVTKLKQQTLLLKGSPTDIEPHLSQVRFGETKARYIVEARNMFATEGRIEIKPRIQSFYNPFELREWFVESVKGLGYKEASHFLRNIGLGEAFAILDRHILRNLASLGVIPEVPASITKKRYLEIEEKLRRFATEIGIPMADLDLLFWSKETGWIFK